MTRQALQPSLNDAVVVVRRHLVAVERRDRTGMSADYRLDAVLERGDDRFVGRDAIAVYFATVPGRLGDRTMRFAEPVTAADGHIDVVWELFDGDGALAASGRDTFIVAEGWISHQVVALDGDDF